MQKFKNIIPFFIPSSWGWNILEGIRKCLVFQITVNVVGVLLNIIGFIGMHESVMSTS